MSSATATMAPRGSFQEFQEVVAQCGDDPKGRCEGSRVWRLRISVLNRLSWKTDTKFQTVQRL